MAYLIAQGTYSKDLTEKKWAELISLVEPILEKYIRKNGEFGMSIHHQEKIYEMYCKVMGIKL